MLEYRLLGPVEVRRDGEAVDIGGGLTPLVLTALLASVNECVPFRTLTDLVWGSDAPRQSRASIYNRVSRLRRALGTAAVETLPGGYRLRAEPEQIDALRFRKLVAEARDAAGGHGTDGTGRAFALLGEALALWRGPALGDLGATTGCAAMARGWHEEHLAAWELRATCGLDLGRHAELVGELAAVVAAHPVDEGLIGPYMVALNRTGRQAEALRRYERLRKELGAELGVDPCAKLQQTYLDILRGEPARAAASVATAPVGARTPVRRLPPAGPRLHGRARDMAVLDAWLAAATAEADHAALAVLVGPAGVGTSALAVAWARRAADRFPDGVLHLDLCGYGPRPALSPATALERLLRALPAAPPRLPLDVEERALLLRTALAERRMLLVLDNAAAAEQVRPLLPAPGCPTLVTSRDQLRGLVVRDGARRLDLAPVDAAAGRAIVADVLCRPATELPAGPAVELVEACAGLPLALRIAAERAGRDGGDLRPVVAALRDAPLDALCGGDQTTDMREALHWSYRRLDPAAARAFRLLGVYQDADFGPRAAAALLGEPEATAGRLLDALVAAHLVQRRCPDRYGLLGPMHRYAGEVAARYQGDTSHASGQGSGTRAADRGGAGILPGAREESAGSPSPDAGFFYTPEQARFRLAAELPDLLAAVGGARPYGPPDGEPAHRLAVLAPRRPEPRCQNARHRGSSRPRRHLDG